ncbi:PadR family transcriptional regulator [Schaalia sp. 19OD2882]|uniref:PadR family transcriptional regulator n=1 Tax=Schaalia sp. 19OD2882 TaxID=2794089 RepID=UPI001C1F0325|nr:PadR family transcriptional regulator [Schaalia sp. 19OD2882]QWW19010.1 PadR family transcriptional regulator [Schaalia sp. 19OD2882]
MELKHIILGFLSIRPMSGYEVDTVFMKSVDHFWHANQSQVYRALDRLAKDALISTEIIRQDGRPDRKVHSLTRAGRTELESWLACTPEPEQVKVPFMAQVFFAAQLGPQRVIDLLRARQELTRAHLAELESLPTTDDDLAAVLRSSTLDLGVAMTRAELDWLDALLTKLERIPK